MKQWRFFAAAVMAAMAFTLTAALASGLRAPPSRICDFPLAFRQQTEQETAVEVAKLIAQLGAKDSDLAKKTEGKLAELGEAALPALYEGWENAVAPVDRIQSVIQRIHREHGLPTWVNGVQFKLIADKEWLVPTAKTPDGRTKINISLQFTNTSKKLVQVALSHKTGIILKDAIGREVQFLYGTDGKLPETATPLLKKGESYTMRYLTSLIGLKGELPRLFINEPNVRAQRRAVNGLDSGKYELVVSYKNSERTTRGGGPYWVGEAETLPQSIVVK